jgi:hypothetical protein
MLMHRSRSVPIVLLAALLVALLPATWPAAAQDKPLPAITSRVVPLADGRLKVVDLLRAVGAALDLKPSVTLDDIGWVIDTRTPRGQGQLESIRRASGGVVSVETRDDHAIVRIDREGLKMTTPL